MMEFPKSLRTSFDLPFFMGKASAKKGFVKGFDWEVHPQAEKVLLGEVKFFLKNNLFARKVSKRLQKETSTELLDWIDHIVVPESRLSAYELKTLGFVEDPAAQRRDGITVFRHSGTVFPPVLLDREERYELALKPDNLDDCVKKIGKRGKILGEEFGPMRKAILNVEKRFVFSAIERRGSKDFIIPDEVRDANSYKRALNTFMRRKRNFSTDTHGMGHVRKSVVDTLKKLSPARTADAFFRAERDYWMSRNKAGLTQFKRQNRVGLGWGNHDHHTYRSSREHFADLIAIFELMGYECRERFYAGEKAGWGAQVLEHPACDIVIFADVDITNKEKDKDFAHMGLAPQKELGTVGLWIGLHGESILQAGMHHLEARFNFKALTKDLKREGVNMMKPFSNFPFLKQAFTEGERWRVDKKRVKKLLDDESITAEQYHGFIARGAIGSHMENLQRRQGYKGFNQNSVTAIIKATNPLKRLVSTEKHHRGA